MTCEHRCFRSPGARAPSSISPASTPPRRSCSRPSSRRAPACSAAPTRSSTSPSHGDAEAAPPRYVIYIELEAEVDIDALARALDASLGAHNPLYVDYRRGDRTRATRRPVAPGGQLPRARGLAHGPGPRRLGRAAQAGAAGPRRRDAGTGSTHGPRAWTTDAGADFAVRRMPPVTQSPIPSATMHRRSFVRASVLGATTTGLASACSQTPREDANAPTAARRHLRQPPRPARPRMDDLRCRPITLGRVASKAANTPLVCREDPLDEQLYRSSLRALLLTGSIKDLPEADRSRPEVQARLDAHAAEVDFAVHGMTHRLAHMPPDELARVQDRLQPRPGPRPAHRRIHRR
jgi:hypothetical protein